MITARSPFGVPRTRVFRGPLHIVWLAVLALGLVFAHGLNRESPVHHFTTASFSAMNSGHVVGGSAGRPGSTGSAGTTASTGIADHIDHAGHAGRTAADPGGHVHAPAPSAAHGDPSAHALLATHSDGSVHPVEQCMPGQPQLNSGTANPGAEAVALSTARDRTTRPAAPARCRPATEPSARPAPTGVLRI
ncbi:hypothetical protein [Streptomyces yaizuensis]|uniref:Uncharacterized protein n=1 Tax=Streptomyces yaizuensis TaxID=2989713 RepID=A0ABQ5P072_9ACTN|nr:hypothetical protein [Streptomyces sp. YSPA8]GLF95870.1 hypothetical protein SYYSPA8_16255 [Streptomyces sp. YSPA8]